MPYTPSEITEESGEGVGCSHSCCELDVDCECEQLQLSSQKR